MTFRADLPLDTANALIAETFAEGARRQLKPLAAVVLDAGGRLVAYQRQDGSSLMRFQIAMGKAAGALGMGMASSKIAAVSRERPSFVAALTALAPDGLVPVAGGVLIGGTDGSVLGAVGVTGDTSDNDELCGLSGIAAVGLKALD